MNPILPLPFLIPIGLALLAAAGLGGWWATPGGSSRRRLLHAGLRVAAVALLLIPALNPGSLLEPESARRPAWVVLADQSASMATTDGADASGPTRWSITQKEAAALAGHLETDATVYANSFDVVRRATEIADFPDRAEGTGSKPLAALEEVLEEVASRDEDLRGIVLWTDGITHEDPAQAERLALTAQARKIPIHVRLIGAEATTLDLKVRVLEPHLTAYSNQTVRVPVRVQSRNLDAARVELILRDDQGDERARRSVQLKAGEDGTAISRTTIEFDELNPEDGAQRFTVEVAPYGDETRHDNNTDSCWVEPVNHRLRVLFVEGTPHWDSKFLMQLLRRQAHIDLTTVHRLASDRYYRVSPDQAEDEGSEIEQALPANEAELRDYDLILFGKGLEYVLNPEHIAALRGFLRSNGGMVLFARGKPYAGAFPELAPLEALDWGTSDRTPRRWRPEERASRDLFGRILPGANDPVWSVAPAMTGINRVEALRPFARTLAVTVPESEAANADVPVLVTRRVGAGVVACVNAEGLWTWDFYPEREASRALYRDLWLGLLQWGLQQSAFPPGRDVLIEALGDDTQSAGVSRLRVRTRDPEAETPNVLWHAGNGEDPRPLEAVAGSEPGEWNVAVRLDQPGDFRVTATVAESEAMLPLRRAAPPGESDELSAREEIPRLLTTLSGGTWLAADPVNHFRDLPPPEATTQARQPTTWQPSWPGWLLLLGAIGLWLLEWSLRRRAGWR